MVTLIHPNGALDRAAIAAEVDRRYREAVERLVGRHGITHGKLLAIAQREIFTHWVEDEARRERRPFIQAAIRYTALEREQVERLDYAAKFSPISSRGNEQFNRCAAEADRIRSVVYQRALAEIEGVPA